MHTTERVRKMRPLRDDSTRSEAAKNQARTRRQARRIVHQAKGC